MGASEAHLRPTEASATPIYALAVRRYVVPAGNVVWQALEKRMRENGQLDTQFLPLVA